MYYTVYFSTFNSSSLTVTGTTTMHLKSLYSFLRHVRVHGKNRQLCTRSVSKEVPLKNEKSFESVVNSARKVAQKSVVIQVTSPHVTSQIQATCKQFGMVQNLFCYLQPIRKSTKNFVLIEMTTEKEADQLIQYCRHQASHSVHEMPPRSRFLWLPPNCLDRTSKKLPTENNPSNHMLNQDKLYSQLLTAKDLSSQMVILYQALRLHELGLRIRFLCAREIEDAILGIYPEARALPFGSSVNGFGGRDCDLDLILHTSGEIPKKASYSGKISCNKSGSYQVFDLMNAIIRHGLPGCGSVQSVPNARVPIIKYTHKFAGVQCDLSFSNFNTDGVMMAKLLYLCGEMDERVRPLIYAVRTWARTRNITRKTPGQHVTNFMLTTMVISYLQCISEPVLPVLALTSKGPGVNMKHLQSLAFEWNSKNTDCLDTLLRGFFVYFENFDFYNMGLSLVSHTPVPIPTAFVDVARRRNQAIAMFIENPLDMNLNVSSNVSKAHVEVLRQEIRLALLRLQRGNTCDPNREWGLLSVCASDEMHASEQNANCTVSRRYPTSDMMSK